MPSNDHSLLARFAHVQVRDLLRFAGQRLREERLPQVAGSLTFTTVLALVPLLTIALAVFTTFPLFDTFRRALDSYFLRSLIPAGIASTILDYLNQFASQATRLSAVGAVALIATAVAMIGTVDRTFNRIWRVRTRRPFAQRVLTYWAVITLGPLLIGVSISVTGYLFAATNGVVLKLPLLGAVMFTLVSLALTAGAFTLLYMVVPNRLIDWRDAACGGVLAAIAFELSKRLFAVFIASFPTYTVLYGALAAIPLFLVWIYLGWMITLMGATLTAALPVVRYERWWHVALPAAHSSTRCRCWKCCTRPAAASRRRCRRHCCANAPASASRNRNGCCSRCWTPAGSAASGTRRRGAGCSSASAIRSGWTAGRCWPTLGSCGWPTSTGCSSLPRPTGCPCRRPLKRRSSRACSRPWRITFTSMGSRGRPE